MEPARDEAAPLYRKRWTIALLLGFGVLVNYLDRVNLSVSHAALHAEFGISDVIFGYLSAAYSWTYAACQFPIGVVLDRFGVRRVGRASTLVWSIASFAAAISPTIGGLFAARLLLGVGEAPTFPANAKAIGMWFAPRERSMPTSIFDAAAKFASAIGVPVVGILLLHIGWRLSFAATGLVSFLYFLLFWRVYRDPEEAQDGDGTPVRVRELPESNAKPEPLLQLLRRRKVLGLMLGMGAYNYVFYLLLTWLPSYLYAALHLNLFDSFLYTGAPWLFATIADLLIGGWLVDALIRRGWNADRVRRVVLIGGTACGLGLLGAAEAHTAGRALFWISVSISGLSAAAPVLWSLPALVVPRTSVGSVGGIVNFAGQISAIVAPIVTGYLVAARHSYAWAFGVAVLYLLVGIAGYLVLLGRVEGEPEAAPA